MPLCANSTSLGADGSNNGALSFTSSAPARLSDAPPRNKAPHTNSSVRYLAASAFARWTRSACSSLLSTGGGTAAGGIADRHEKLLLRRRRAYAEQARRPVRLVTEEVVRVGRRCSRSGDQRADIAGCLKPVIANLNFVGCRWVSLQVSRHSISWRHEHPLVDRHRRSRPRSSSCLGFRKLPPFAHGRNQVACDAGDV